jgi:hypothetical protein
MYFCPMEQEEQIIGTPRQAPQLYGVAPFAKPIFCNYIDDTTDLDLWLVTCLKYLQNMVERGS